MAVSDIFPKFKILCIYIQSGIGEKIILGSKQILYQVQLKI